MSTENETQIIPAPPPTTEASTLPEKKVTIECKICEGTINDGDTKLICSKPKCAAVTCTTCIDSMLKTMFSHPTLNYPLSCGACEQSFDTTDVDHILIKHQQYEQFIACVLPLFWSKDCLQQNEQLAQCPFCPYVEIHTTDACPVHFMICQHPSCGKRSCLTCLHTVEDDADEATHRARCVELRGYKEMVEKAIESGSQQKCPDCELTGVKDDACTHMVCERCQVSWCYFCGMKEEECPVDDCSDQSLSAHNERWERYEERCPMHLENICQVDGRWPYTDQDCLEYFHRYRTICELYEVMKIVGEEKLDELNENFGTIDASGYTVEEIKDYENRVLIKHRSKYND